MAYKNDNYQPNKKSAEILARGWGHVKSIPYRATSRWLFYRLLQDGVYKSKDDYKNLFIPLFSRARHNQYQGWRPDTLVDDRRSPIEYDNPWENIDEWVRSMSSSGWSCRLDHFYRQSFYCEVWFEAEAMVNQFKYYTNGVTLCPFSGMPSISYKYSIAQRIATNARTYHLPVVILYFGDYDEAGLTIPETSVNDIRGWCNVDFDFVRCGLNEGDNNKYDIPENIEKPGAYQWEGLSDQAAAELIRSSVARFVDAEKISEAQQEGAEAASIFDDYVANFADYYHAKHNYDATIEQTD